ncbi:MAG: DUF4198 domain-containing protein [bacterium]|nr:DUF4198 domain-containing protein [bacterium]
MKRMAITLFTLLMISSAGWAHFPIVLPSQAWADAGQAVSFFYVNGHPYEREWEDTLKAGRISVFDPHGEELNLTSSAKSVDFTMNARSVKRLEWSYTPVEKGDYIIAVDTEPYVMHSQSAYQDFVKVILHCDRQDGWRNRTGRPVEIVPLTRPYGLPAGAVFTAQVMKGDQPVAGAEVEIEHYNEIAPDPDHLPPDPMITGVVVTDPNGIFTVTLPKAGWWIVACAVDEAGTIELEGKTHPLNALAGMYVHVDEPVK